MKVRKGMIAVALPLVLLIGGAVVWCGRTPQPARAPTPAAPPIAQAEPAIRAKGTLVPVRQTKLVFRAAGRVQTVAVRPGDVVKAGQLLAALDSRELDLQVRLAEEGLASSRLAAEQVASAASPEQLEALQAAYEASQARYAEAQQGVPEAETLAAASALASAQQQQAQVEASASADEKVARANLDAAKAKLAQLQAGPRDQDLKAAEFQVEQTKLSLWSAQLSRNGTCGNPSTPEYVCKSADAQVSSAELAVKVAEQSLAKVKASAQPEDLLAAQAAVDQAQAALDAHLASRDHQLAAARAAVAAAESKLRRLKAGPVEADVKSAQSAAARDKAALLLRDGDSADLDLRIAKLKVAEAEDRLTQAKLASDGAKLVAPYDGTVAAVLVAEHDQAAAGATAIVLADLSSLRVETTDLDQGSISKVALGQPAKVTVTAFDDKVLPGKVSEVTPMAITGEAGDVSYPIVIALDRQDPDLRWGMTVSVDLAPDTESRSE